MIAVDTNLLVYAHRCDAAFHERAKELINGLRGATAPWAIPWPCVHEFLSIVTNPRIYKVAPSPLVTAFAAVSVWASAGNLHFIAESEGYFDKLHELATAARLQGARIHDARVAALCLHHGVRVLWTADRDFSAFPQLPTQNPLIG